MREREHVEQRLSTHPIGGRPEFGARHRDSAARRDAPATIAGQLTTTSRSPALDLRGGRDRDPADLAGLGCQ